MKLKAGIPGALKRAFTILPSGQTAHPAPGIPADAELEDTLAARLDKQLILPCVEDPAEDLSRAAVQDHGQFLARQDRWDDLSAAIRVADADRASTPCAMSHAELLSYGARADVVHATEDALADDMKPSLDGIEALEEVLSESADDYPIAVTVALAHADIGWAWRGPHWPHELPDRNQRLFRAHFERSNEILAPFADQVSRSPLIASAQCTLMTGQEGDGRELADRYEALIDLDPGNPRPMRAMGNHLLPRWFGSYEELELEARRTAARTSQTWGAGAYAWVFMDALAVDPGAARAVDLDFFTDGMRDILAARPDQHFANLMAAYAAIEMDPARTPANAPDILFQVRNGIHETLDWILAEYLYELHPLVWAQAAIGPSQCAPLPIRAALVRRGVVTARRTIARHFASDLLAGTTVAFSRHGLRLYPAV